jgi:hypothetical protein
MAREKSGTGGGAILRATCLFVVGFFIATAAIHPLVRDSLGLYGSERSVKLEMESAAITSNILRPPSGRATPRWDSIRESSTPALPERCSQCMRKLRSSVLSFLGGGNRSSRVKIPRNPRSFQSPLTFNNLSGHTSEELSNHCSSKSRQTSFRFKYS